MTSGGSDDYNSWRSLILEIEATCPEDIDTTSLAYESFLAIFPLCHWHLEKYACYIAERRGAQEAVKIYERGAAAAMYSVGFWVDYFSFGTSCFEDPEDVRRLFGRAETFVGRDYYCHVIWDKYMKYEFSQGGWRFLALSYIQALRFPTKKLHFYYDNFKQFVANLEEEIGLEKGNNMEVVQPSSPRASTEISRDEISLVINDLLDSSDVSIKSRALDRYRAIGEGFYQEGCQMEEKIKCFEKKIHRRYFYVTPVDDDEISNWHLYLDFIEDLDDLDWAVKLYERCLIPCANYPEFWTRYVEFLESKGGRELALCALDRAAQLFLKNVPEIHLFSARFKEHLGDANGARAALLRVDAKTDASFIEKTMALSNIERRLGNFKAASAAYEIALEAARERRRLHVLPTLYIQFAYLTFSISGSSAAARDVLIEGVRNVPDWRFLVEELIKFAMTHEGASHLNVIDAIIVDVITPESDEYKDLNAKDRESLSLLFLEYVNLCGTLQDLRKAWSRHVKLFPQFLRMRTAYNKSTSGNYLSGGIAGRKGDQPSGDECSGNHLQIQGQKQVLKSAVNDEIQPNEMLERLSLPENNKISAEETVVRQGSQEANLIKQDASGNSEPAYELSRQYMEDNLGRIIFSAELTSQSKGNALSTSEPDQDPAGGKGTHMDVRTELVKPSNGNALILHEGAQEPVSLATTEPIQPNSLNFPEKEPQESTPMAVDKNESQRGVSGESTPGAISNVEFNSSAASSSVQTDHICNELVRDRSTSHQQNISTKRWVDPDEPSKADAYSNEIDNHTPPPATGPSTSCLKEQLPGLESKLEQSLHHGCHPTVTSGRSMHVSPDTAQQNLDKQKSGLVEDTVSDKGQSANNMTPPTNVSSGQTPASTQPVSYSMPNVNPMASQNGQYPWQTQQSLDMNQMLQYHYQQQQLLQQQYQQQQMQMQQAYFQLQQNYQQYYQQLQPHQKQQQHNQQQLQPMVQQQPQLSPYQAYQMQQNFSTFQHPQQPSQHQHYQHDQQQVVGNLPVQQGQEAPNFQQIHMKQPLEAQDSAYQERQLAYQQQLILQQYQQYQAYQQMQLQHQSQDGTKHVQEQQIQQHPVQNQQGEQLQKQQQVISTNLTQHASQNQQVSRSASTDYDSETKPSESKHLQSP
ncbi:pre-mRNA-processing factor 39-2 isoform X3 [Andrographis paniculata]|nr:pre-mRNA-processing factor 39-2 isoform X3 [Andrographis paniculata]